MRVRRVERARAPVLVPAAPPSVGVGASFLTLLGAVQGTKDGSYGLAFLQALGTHHGAAVRAAAGGWKANSLPF